MSAALLSRFDLLFILLDRCVRACVRACAMFRLLFTQACLSTCGTARWARVQRG